MDKIMEKEVKENTTNKHTLKRKVAAMDCGECGGDMHRNGWLVTREGRAQKYHCSSCGCNEHGQFFPHIKKVQQSGLP